MIDFLSFHHRKVQAFISKMVTFCLLLSGCSISFPTTNRGAVGKDGAEIPQGRSLTECITYSGDLYLPPPFMFIHWKRQRYLTWSDTHEIPSWLQVTVKELHAYISV